MKYVVPLAFSILCSAAIAKTKVLLEPTTESDSLQAKLVQILSNYAEADKKSKTPTNYVRTSEKGLTVEDSKSSLNCLEGTEGMLQVQTYQCTLKTK